ncbi:MAG: helix-turn-helix transcriptional regulator [Muribaculaceae bacterium]|nr:helix-turn-helix transcriptional regulator [Muribaculaceae bacterium]
MSCKRTESDGDGSPESLRRVLYVQSLYNNHPGDDIVPLITSVIDSMRNAGRDPYYFAAVNILIDRLFSDGRFSEADSLAVSMEEEASEDDDSVSMAMARRVRAQMYYKLEQPARSLRELQTAASYITHPYRSASDFGTATSICEWLWIVARELGDTATMNNAGLQFSRLVEDNEKIHNRNDSTFHYPITALAFRAEDSFSKGDKRRVEELLDSASAQVVPAIPARAYEHLYAVRCKVRAESRDWSGAIADIDTLLAAHQEFPWFYVKDLLLKARMLERASRHEESTAAYSEYVSFHDSLAKNISDKRLHDLTVLYRGELSREHQKTESLRMFVFGIVILLLGISLILSFLYSARVKKRNRLLVEKLKEIDRNAAASVKSESQADVNDMSLIDRLDRYMTDAVPYHDPSLSSKELAEFCGVSVESLRSLVKTEKGCSVKNYINSFRVEEARLVLGSGSDEGVSELAARLGFGTARTLQRAFKERFDMSPSQYREAAREIERSDNQ